MKLMVIDGNSIVNRAFYGVSQNLSTREGLPTNAIFGFVNILLKLLEEEQPEGLAVAFDLKAPTFRHLAYEGYKAQRKGMPEELAGQMPGLKRLLGALDIRRHELAGWEAGDPPGTQARGSGGGGSRQVDATHVGDLLQSELPGIEFSYSMNQQVSLNMSGFGGNSVLFLVDGERLAGETLDNVDYSRLNMDNVGRIEIVKGAVSSLYGSNAIGGVVNIISRESREPWSVNLNGRYGAHNEQRYGGPGGVN